MLWNLDIVVFAQNMEFPKNFLMQWRHDTQNENGNTDTFHLFIESDSVAAATHLDSKIVNPFENEKF